MDLKKIEKALSLLLEIESKRIWSNSETLFENVGQSKEKADELWQLSQELKCSLEES